MGKRKFFVTSTSVPDDLVEEVARFAHRRGCDSFDGGMNKPRRAPSFTGTHKANDMLWASVHIADLCNVLQVTPEALLSLRGETTVPDQDITDSGYGTP